MCRIYIKIFSVNLLIFLSSQVRASREGGGQGGGGGEEEEEAGGEGRQEARAHAQVIDGVMDTKVIDGAQLFAQVIQVIIIQ